MKIFVQKYRLYLGRLQKDGDRNASSSGIQHSDLPAKDPTGSCSSQNPINRQQNDVSVLQNVDGRSHEGGINGIISEPMIDRRTDLIDNIHDTCIRRSSQKGHDQSFGHPDSERNYATFDCVTPTQYCCSVFPEMQLKNHKSCLSLKDSFSQLPLHSIQHHIQVDQSQTTASISSNSSGLEGETAACIETKPLYADDTSDYAGSLGSIWNADTFSMQSKSFMVNDPCLETITTSNPSKKTQGFNPSCISDLEFNRRNLLLGGEVASAPMEDLKSICLQGECYNMNSGLQNIQMPEYYDPGLIGEVPNLFYDMADCSAVDQGKICSSLSCIFNK